MKCDASHNGLGACLEQEIEPGVWAPTAFASRFLNNAETKYSTNELELLAIVWACEHFRTYLLGNRFQVLTDHKAIISALSENYNNKSYQSRLSRWADRLLPFDFEVIHVPGVTLGNVDYLSRHPTFPAPAPSIYDELFVVNSIEAFNSALSFINTFNILDSSSKLCSSSQEVDVPQIHKSKCFLDQSNHVMQIRAFGLSPREGVESCCCRIDQSETGMLINNRKPNAFASIHCLRPELLKDSRNSFFSSLTHSTNSLLSHFSIYNNMNPSKPTSLPHSALEHTKDKPTTQPAHNPIQHSSYSTMEEQAELLSFVENFKLSSPNFRRPSPRPSVRSRQVGRISRLDQVRQRNRTRERAAKTRFFAARTVSRREGHNQLSEALRKCRLSRQGRAHSADKVGVYAINGGKPIISKSKKEIVGLPGLFDADLLAELTEEDRFLGPMKRAINNKDVSSFNKLGTYMAQFWSKAAVVNNCVIIDNKLAIPEVLRPAVLARLHRSHPGQEAMMSASEYIWWPFMNRQIVDTCERCRECTLYGKNLKPVKTFHTAQSLSLLTGPNQELQLDFAGPIVDDRGVKIFLLVAIDRFSKFPSVLITKTTGAKKVTKFLESYIRIHGLPHSIRTDHGSGFKNEKLQQFCTSKGIKHIFSPVGDHRGSGLVERTIQTIKRKLGTEQLEPTFGNLKEVLYRIIEDIRKSNHSTLKKSPFELHFGRKPNTEWSQAFHNIVNSDTSAQRLERNLLTPDQIASQDYSRDRAKVVPRGSLSPQISPRFNLMFSLEGNIADSAPYKALADLARAANNWSQQKRNLPPDGGKRVLQELSSRHSDLAQSLKTGLSRKTLYFAEDRSINTPPEVQDTVRRLPTLQPRRQSKTSKLETLLLSDPTRVRVFRKIIDRQSGKPLFKLAKFKITRVTDHTYVTDKGKVYRKNHVCLKPNYNNISATYNTLGDRLQTSSSKSGGKKPFTRASNPKLLEKRQANTSASYPAVVDLTADSSSESPPVQHALHETRTSTPMEKRLRLHDESQPVTFGSWSLTPGPFSMDTSVDPPLTIQPAESTTWVAGSHQVPLDVVDSESPIVQGKGAQADQYSSLPSLSLPAQPTTDDLEGTRASSRNKKATRFFGDPLRHSVKSVEEAKSLGKEADLSSSTSIIPSSKTYAKDTSVPSSFTSPKRRPLVRDRLHLTSPEASFSSSPVKAQDEI